MTNLRSIALFAALFLALLVGCRSPYYADQGALAGGLGGAGLGAIIGSASGHTGAGALIGAAAGSLTGAAVGSGLDDIEARNRAQIAAQMGRPIAPGATSVADVVAMTKAGVNEQLIATHVQTHGLNQVLQANDLIYLQQQGVSPTVIAAMQQPPQMAAPQQVVYAAPPPAVVYAAPAYYPPPYYYRPRPCGGPGVSWGVAVSGH